MAFIITAGEIVDMLVMTVAVGYIFMDVFRREESDDPVENWRNRQSLKQRLLYASGVVAPPLILHELGHKFVALGYGLTATFQAAYGWLGLGVVLKLIQFPFLVIVPAYVSIHGQAAPLTHALIAFAGPGVNLLLFFVALVALRTSRPSPQWRRFWQYTKLINGFLFVFNMLPIPGFDGLKVYTGLWQAFS